MAKNFNIVLYYTMENFMTALGLGKQRGGGCCSNKSVSLTGGWKHSSKASLASSKRLSMRISKIYKRGTRGRGTRGRGTRGRGTRGRNAKRRNAKRRGTRRRGTRRRGTRGRKR